MTEESQTNMDNTFPVLYILMRTDLPSMNAGKAMAQASHASNAYMHGARDLKRRLVQGEFEDSSDFEAVRKQVEMAERWENETNQGFGTVLVLAVNETQMRTAVSVAQSLGFNAGVVNDPTYPYFLDNEAAGLVPEEVDTAPRIPKGNSTVLFRSEDTCAFVGGDKNDPMLNAVVGNFPLHP